VKEVERILKIVLCHGTTKNYFQYPFHKSIFILLLSLFLSYFETVFFNNTMRAMGFKIELDTL